MTPNKQPTLLQPVEEDKEVEQEDDEDEDEEYDSGGSGVALTPPESPGLI